MTRGLDRRPPSRSARWRSCASIDDEAEAFVNDEGCRVVVRTLREEDHVLRLLTLSAYPRHLRPDEIVDARRTFFEGGATILSVRFGGDGRVVSFLQRVDEFEGGPSNGSTNTQGDG